MSEAGLEREFVTGVVEHMNSDHADAVLNIARHYGRDREISEATMTGLTVSHMLVRAASPAGEANLELPLPKTITGPGDVRSLLIRMSRDAREGLDDMEREAP